MNELTTEKVLEDYLWAVRHQMGPHESGEIQRERDRFNRWLAQVQRKTYNCKDPRRVVIESPYAGDIDSNTSYARTALRDCLERGEAPMASHLLYTQPGVLDDDVPAERELGIEAGLAWGRLADATVIYADLGITPGMKQGIERARIEGRPIEIRTLK